LIMYPFASRLSRAHLLNKCFFLLFRSSPSLPGLYFLTHFFAATPPPLVFLTHPPPQGKSFPFLFFFTTRLGPLGPLSSRGSPCTHGPPVHFFAAEAVPAPDSTRAYKLFFCCTFVCFFFSIPPREPLFISAFTWDFSRSQVHQTLFFGRSPIETFLFAALVFPDPLNLFSGRTPLCFARSVFCFCCSSVWPRFFVFLFLFAVFSVPASFSPLCFFFGSFHVG